MFGEYAHLRFSRAIVVSLKFYLIPATFEK